MTEKEAIRDVLNAIEAHPEAKAWVDSRPPEIQAMIRRRPPDTWWRMKGGGEAIYTPSAWSEDGTLSVTRYDWFGLAWGVFGVNPDDLEWTPDTPDNVTFGAGRGALYVVEGDK